MRVFVPIVTLLLAISCTEPNPYLGVCGNGVLEPDFDEECDDGAGNGEAAACSKTCRMATCGDGLVQPGEECDLGAQNSNNGSCTLDCELALCGDGFVQPGEFCDDGAANRWPADGEPGCSSFCDALPYCGDGAVHPDLGEECDDANDVDDDACTNACKLTSCGDGDLQGDEECDDANDIDTDACTNACKFAVCGDGIVHDGKEDCDDANDDNGDACLNACIAASCGDGVLYEGMEECDDGNLDPDDGCNAECVVDRAVFVTAEVLEIADFGGLDGADALCQGEAEAAGLPRADRFVAWLSDSKSSPSTRFETRNARYVLVDGSAIADDWDDLTDGALSHPINRFADGTLEPTSAVWTATMPSGEASEDGVFCGDWTVPDDSLVRFGSVAAADEDWTYRPDTSWCFDIARLYCFED